MHLSPTAPFIKKGARSAPSSPTAPGPPSPFKSFIDRLKFRKSPGDAPTNQRSPLERGHSGDLMMGSQRDDSIFYSTTDPPPAGGYVLRPPPGPPSPPTPLAPPPLPPTLADVVKAFHPPPQMPPTSIPEEKGNAIGTKAVTGEFWDDARISEANSRPKVNIKSMADDPLVKQGLHQLLNAIQHHNTSSDVLSSIRHLHARQPVVNTVAINESAHVSRTLIDSEPIISEVIMALFPPVSNDAYPQLWSEIPLPNCRIDLGVYYPPRGRARARLTRQAICSTCEFKTFKIFSDSKLDSSDLFCRHSLRADIIRSTEGQSVAEEAHFAVKIIDPLQVLQPEQHKDVQEILLCALQAMGYGHTTRTRLAIFTNGNRFIIVRCVPDSTGAFVVSPSYGRRSDAKGTSVRGGPNYALAIHLLAIAYSNILEAAKTDFPLGLDAQGCPLPVDPNTPPLQTVNAPQPAITTASQPTTQADAPVGHAPLTPQLGRGHRTHGAVNYAETPGSGQSRQSETTFYPTSSEEPSPAGPARL